MNHPHSTLGEQTCRNQWHDLADCGYDRSPLSLHPTLSEVTFPSISTAKRQSLDQTSFSIVDLEADQSQISMLPPLSEESIESTQSNKGRAYGRRFFTKLGRLFSAPSELEEPTYYNPFDPNAKHLYRQTVYLDAYDGTPRRKTSKPKPEEPTYYNPFDPNAHHLYRQTVDLDPSDIPRRVKTPEQDLSNVILSQRGAKLPGKPKPEEPTYYNPFDPNAHHLYHQTVNIDPSGIPRRVKALDQDPLNVMQAHRGAKLLRKFKPDSEEPTYYNLFDPNAQYLYRRTVYPDPSNMS